MITKTKIMLARRFRMLREQRNWSTHDLKRLSGVSQKTIWNIEHADETDISFTLDNAERLAHVHGYELWQLLIPLHEGQEQTEFKAVASGVVNLFRDYSQTDAEGRVFLEQMAEREARRANVDEL